MAVLGMGARQSVLHFGGLTLADVTERSFRTLTRVDLTPILKVVLRRIFR